ncbi:SMP-30/gluconolactonase/LRE family protein [uncultured Sphingomonas sp.]|uniref:SMP-30/gluconolactonase/LRE family protein n=1 Tax=uncultured Sphingomonas sp. TaxID=158754 RepID=UPI0035CBB9B5
MSADAQIVARDRRDLLGEGPLWHPAENALYWVDILARRINRLHLGDGRVDSWVMPEMIGWIIARRDAPGFLAGLQSGVKAVTFAPLTVAAFADLAAEPAGNRMNDAKADAHGRIWAGTMPVGCDRPSGALYRLDPGGALTQVDGGYHIANGPAISPDGRWLFHTNTFLREIYRFPLHDDGTLGSRALWLRFADDGGTPDGMTFDAEGGLWIAHWGGARVSRFDPDGRVERVRRLPATQITSMAFAGERLDRLFVTSAGDGVDEPHGGDLFEVDAGVRGLAPHAFGRENGYDA